MANTQCLSCMCVQVESVCCDGGCRNRFCYKCTKLNRQEYKLVCDNKSIKWFCNKCEECNLMSKISDIFDEIKKQKIKIETNESILTNLKEKLEENNNSLKNNIIKEVERLNANCKQLVNGSSRSFADIAKLNIKEQAVVICPKNKEQNSDKTKED